MALNRNWGAVLSLTRRLDWLIGDQTVFAHLGSAGLAVLATLPDSTRDDDYLDLMTAHDEVMEQFDDFTAATLLLAQREITYFVSAVGCINSRLATPLSWSISKGDLLKRSSNVELLDASANYVKHADEWPVDWDKASHRGQKKTIRVLTGAGVVDFDRWKPLPLLRQRLGIDRDLGKVVEHLHPWATDIIEQVANELEGRKEIPSGWKLASRISAFGGQRRHLASGL